MSFMQAFSRRSIFGALLGGLPLFLAFLGVGFMHDLVSTSGGYTRPGIGLWSFTIGMIVVFLVYSALFFSKRVQAPVVMKIAYLPLVLAGAVILMKMFMILVA